MREILFRGRNENSTWIYGSLLVDKDTFDKNAFIYYICDIDGYSMEIVNTKTIGQFTGLTDKNGTKIFEGDIVMHIQKHEISGKVKSIAVIKWDEAYSCYSVEYTNDRITAFLGTEHHRLEVIGNIHDTPELLNK